MKGFPTKEESTKLFQKYVLLSNVERHCVSVASLACYIGDCVQKSRGADLNMNLIFATSLFHDLAKASQVKVLEPEKYGFEPFTEEQMQTWKMLRNLSDGLEKLYDDLNVVYPNLNKHIHETDVMILMVSSLWPEIVPFLYQIGGTRNESYATAGLEIKIMHYADWILHVSNIVPFEVRLDYLFEKYWNDLPIENRMARKEREFALEREVFEGLYISPDIINLSEVNKMKHELFSGAYDSFEIGQVSQID